jgi:hypothetical protein
MRYALVATVKVRLEGISYRARVRLASGYQEGWLLGFGV